MRRHHSTYAFRRWIAVGILLLFAAYYADINCFVHSHIINGVTIVHSHFHQPSHHDTDTGGHSETEVVLIAMMQCEPLQLAPEQTLLPEAQYVLLGTLSCLPDAEIASPHLACVAMRAPPQC